LFAYKSILELSQVSLFKIIPGHVYSLAANSQIILWAFKV